MTELSTLQIRFNAPLILGLALASLAALVLDSLTRGAANRRLFSVYRCSLYDPLALVRFFTHVLGHTSIEHYMGNMLLLLLIGPSLEERYGAGVLAACIAVTALVTGLVEFLFFPRHSLLGASGVIFMMIVLTSFTGAERGEIPRDADRRDGAGLSVACQIGHPRFQHKRPFMTSWKTGERFPPFVKKFNYFFGKLGNRLIFLFSSIFGLTSFKRKNDRKAECF